MPQCTLWTYRAATSILSDRQVRTVTPLILVDDREPASIKTALEHACETAKIPFSVHREQFGDFHLYPPTGVQKVVAVERKAVSDFVSSLTSGRLQTQLDGLATICDIPYLLIEGDLKSTMVAGKHMLLLGNAASKFNLFSLHMFLASIQDSGVRWAHTGSVTHTVLWIVKNYMRLCRGETETTIFAKPKEKIARPDVAAMCAVPGMGEKMAVKLLSKFGTVLQTASARDEALLATPGFGPSALKELRSTFGHPTSLSV